MIPQKRTMALMMAWRMPPMPLMTAMMASPIVRSAALIYSGGLVFVEVGGGLGEWLTQETTPPMIAVFWRLGMWLWCGVV